jgi:hypothetical protein
MRLAKQIMLTAAAGGLLWALTPQVAAADTPAKTAQFRAAAHDGLQVTEVRYPYRAYYRPYATPYVGRYGYGAYYGGHNAYSRPYVRPYAYPYYTARPNYGYSYGPRWRGYYGRPRYGYRYGYRW